MGRPSLYTPELVETICERLAAGEFLTVICRDEGMPDPATVWRWREERPDVSQAIARARELGEYALAEQCREIADDSSADFIPGKNGPVLDAEHVQRSKLRIDTRLKLLAKFNPKRWGDKLEVDNKGELTLNVALKRFTPDPLESSEEPAE